MLQFEELRDEKFDAIFADQGKIRAEAYLKMRHAFGLMIDGLCDAGFGQREDENFTETPHRVAKYYLEMFKSDDERKKELELNFSKTFKSDYQGIILQPNLRSYSMCPHHFLPIEIRATVAYIPGNSKNAVGLSKLARAVEICAARPMLQETLSHDIADAIMNLLKPAGCGVVIEGAHGCMRCRGVKQPDSWTITSEVRGTFENHDTKAEFMHLYQVNRKPD